MQITVDVERLKLEIEEKIRLSREFPNCPASEFSNAIIATLIIKDKRITDCIDYHDVEEFYKDNEEAHDEQNRSG
ncbi:MAG: hypothetical protein M1356_09225 [Gammaproteobacteria bacterium]|nr:hypothetical protein [Gammaproteobacteria bacterium]